MAQSQKASTISPPGHHWIGNGVDLNSALPDTQILKLNYKYWKVKSFISPNSVLVQLMHTNYIRLLHY
jgi:hypothetical protein